MFDFNQGPYSGVGTPSGGLRFPTTLSFRDAWPMVQSSEASRPFLGVDGQFDPVSVDLESDSPHVLINGGTGGGKSTIVRSLVAQHLASGGVAIFLDVKRHSHRWAKGLEPNVRYASTLPDIGNALVEVGKEVHKRNDVVDRFPGPVENAPVGPAVMVVFEELNATMDALRDLDKSLPDGSYKALDGLRDLIFMGRAARMHCVATAQLASRRAAGGAEILANFNCKILVRYDETGWRWLVGGRFQPAPQQPGRGKVVQGGAAKEVQFMSISEEDARNFVTHSSRAQATARALCPRLIPLPRVWKRARSNEV